MKSIRRTLLALVSTACLAQVAQAIPMERSARQMVPREVEQVRAEREGDYSVFLVTADRQRTSYNYGDLLAFARCVVHFDADAPMKTMAEPIGTQREEAMLARMGDVYRACLGGPVQVHPLLLRAALAEVALERGPRAPALKYPIGVPAVALGRPLQRTSRCQLETVPEMVAAVFASRPGSAGERDAVGRLFAAAPECGSWDLAKTSPTVARLSLLEARYRFQND